MQFPLFSGKCQTWQKLCRHYRSLPIQWENKELLNPLKDWFFMFQLIWLKFRKHFSQFSRQKNTFFWWKIFRPRKFNFLFTAHFSFFLISVSSCCRWFEFSYENVSCFIRMIIKSIKYTGEGQNEIWNKFQEATEVHRLRKTLFPFYTKTKSFLSFFGL